MAMLKDAAATWISVAKTSDVPPGEVICVEVNGRSIALYHLEDGDFSATDNICTHALAYLSDGILEGCLIECPLHAGAFDVRTGKGQGAPITEDLEVFPLRITGESIEIALT